MFLFVSLNAQTTLHTALDDVNEVIVHDVFSAPAASRIYAYTAISAYEAIVPGYANYKSFHGKLNNMPEMPAISNFNEIDFELAGIFALYYTAQSFIFSVDVIQEKINILQQQKNAGGNELIVQATQLYAKNVSDKIIAWSKGDNYDKTRNKERYIVKDFPAAWKPTGPDYGAAIEPYWGELRTFIIDTKMINNLIEPPHFNTDSNSIFYAQANEVFTTVNNLTEEQAEIANFWDDNPFTITYVGHLQYAKKRISPAGHWLNIAGTALVQTGASNIQSAYVYALCAITIADATVAAWQLKYDFNLIRPETYIQTYMNSGWEPYIITPAFPEYPSGHSTVSAACATILTYCIGDNFSFSDSIESAYGYLPRNFPSFQAAANEASMSRLYAGIHFRAALMDGATYGNNIAEVIFSKTQW